MGRQLPARFVSSLRSRTADAFRARLRPVDGAVELIQSMSRSQWSLGVASSGPAEKIELSLSLTGLRTFFEGRIFSSYDVGVWKPDPGLFLHAASALGVAAQDCAVVEDSLPGIQAGIAAGMTVFAFQPNDVDPRIPADVTVVRELLALPKLLAGGAAGRQGRGPSGADRQRRAERWHC